MNFIATPRNVISSLLISATLGILLAVTNLNLALGDEIFYRNPLIENPGKNQKEIKSVRGTIKEDDMNANEIVITSSSKKSEIVETTNVEAIKYDREPREFDQIREKIVRKDFQGAYEDLQGMIKEAEKNKIDLAFYNEFIKQEFEYLQVYLPAMTTLTGTSSATVGAVVVPLMDFAKKHPKHYRFFEATEIIGHLAVLAGGDKKLDNAKRFYGVLNESSLKENKARMNLFYSRALLSEGKSDEVPKYLSAVIQERSEVKTYASIIQQAKVALAIAQATSGQADEAIKRLEQIVDETPMTDRETHAWANLALGNIYDLKKQKINALMSFLKIDKIDKMATNFPEIHAEALSKLARLWNEIPNRNLENANASKERLQSLYPYSRWNK